MDALRASLAAIGRARVATLTVAATYAISVIAGIAMVGAGNPTALARRDAIVSGAQTSAITEADTGGDHLRAALLDFASNLVLGGATSTVLGVAVVMTYPVAAYRGWVGGIVSVDGQHRSRLADPPRAFYYLVTLVLQLIPYSIAGGVGVHLGIGSLRAILRRTDTWLGLPKREMRDVGLAYVLVIPLFLIASLFEFLA